MTTPTTPMQGYEHVTRELVDKLRDRCRDASGWYYRNNMPPNPRTDALLVLAQKLWWDGSHSDRANAGFMGGWVFLARMALQEHEVYRTSVENRKAAP